MIPPCSSAGTMIRLSKSVRVRRISCTMLCPPSSSCSTSLWHSFTFALVHTLSLPFPQICSKTVPQWPDFSALYAWRIGTPSTRKSVLCRKMSSSSLCGVSCCHLPSVPNRLTFSASTKTDLAHAFSESESFPQSTQEMFQTKRCP